MTLGTFYAYDHEQPPEPEEPTPPVDDRHSIKWGYNLADLARLARFAVGRCRARSGDYLDRYEAAWSAIAEHIFTAKEYPDPADVVNTGTEAVARHCHRNTREHGGNNYGEPMPAFERYWTPPTASSVEDRVIESMAVWQILPTLTPAQRRAVTALAATGDYELAAAANGTKYGAFAQSLWAGRRRFTAFWFEGETPPKPRRDQRRAGGHLKKALTASQVEAIRGRYYAGATQDAIAAEYGVGQSTISAYLRGVTAPDSEDAS